MIKRTLSLLSNIINSLMKILGIILLIAIVVLTFAGVISRFIFNKTIVWQYELTLVLFSWLIFVGVTLAFYKKENIRVTVLDQALNIKGKYVERLIINVIILAFLIIAVIEGFTVVNTTWKLYYMTIHIRKGLFYLSLPVCALLSIFVILNNMVSLNTEAIAEEVKENAPVVEATEEEGVQT